MMRPAPDDGTGVFRRLAEIAVDVRLDGTVYVATSPMVRGLVVVSQSREALFEKVQNAMRDLTESHLRDWENEV